MEIDVQKVQKLDFQKLCEKGSGWRSKIGHWPKLKLENSFKVQKLDNSSIRLKLIFPARQIIEPSFAEESFIALGLEINRRK